MQTKQLVFMETSSQTPEVNKKMTTDNPENTSIVLPGDIMNGIFSRLPVKPVFQLQCLSKNFSSITEDPSFIDDHLKHSARLRPSLMLGSGHDILLIQSNGLDSETTVEEVPLHKNIVMRLRTNSNPKFEIVGSCNGLCVVYVYDIVIDEFKEDCFLLNPSTNKWDHLPSPGRILGFCWEATAWGFGYCTESRVYKIVRIAYFTSKLSYSLEDFTNSKLLVGILTCGHDPVWRKLDFRKFSKLCSVHEIFNAEPGMTVKGFVYWNPFNDEHGESKLILTFDLEKEKFAFILCPISVGGRIMQLKDYLAISSFSECNAVEIWVLKNVMCNAVHHDDDDHDVSSIINESFWEKVYTTNGFSPRTIPVACLGDRQLLLGRYAKKYSYFWYDLETKGIREIPLLSAQRNRGFNVFYFVESLVPI